MPRYVAMFSMCTVDSRMDVGEVYGASHDRYFAYKYRPSLRHASLGTAPTTKYGSIYIDVLSTLRRSAAAVAWSMYTAE